MRARSALASRASSPAGARAAAAGGDEAAGAAVAWLDGALRSFPSDERQAVSSNNPRSHLVMWQKHTAGRAAGATKQAQLLPEPSVG